MVKTHKRSLLPSRSLVFCNKFHFRCSLTLVDQHSSSCKNEFSAIKGRRFNFKTNWFNPDFGLFDVDIQTRRRRKLDTNIQRTLMKKQESSTWKLLSHEDVTGKFLSGFGSNLRFAQKGREIAQLFSSSSARMNVEGSEGTEFLF